MVERHIGTHGPFQSNRLFLSHAIQIVILQGDRVLLLFRKLFTAPSHHYAVCLYWACTAMRAVFCDECVPLITCTLTVQSLHINIPNILLIC